ncbi:cytochrome P450 [Pluteus cervinus]|uniref:Cytochrome P450 n=1 Tax=Pluteus cervinus TaxID=181527 RepID=A0ACD3AVX6_9AGAR|nr:cytochrome P450 [Pluteus cervinus]
MAFQNATSTLESKSTFYSSNLNSIFTVSFILLLAVLLRRSKGKTISYPPGPKPIPFLGNILDMPKEYPWIAFKKWSDKYGSDLVFASVLGKRIVVVNSYTVAQDLFTKRSAIYSSRPELPMVNDLLGWSWAFNLMPYGPAWKEQRKLFKQEAEVADGRSHEPHALLAARRFLKHMLETPDDFTEHLRHMTALFVVSMAYGIDIKPRGDPYVAIVERANACFSRAGNFGSYFVDFFPALKYVPDWFPGAQFKRDAKEWSKDVLALPHVGFELAKKGHEQGTGRECITSRVLEAIQNDEDREHKEHVLKCMLGGFYAAGADTVVNVLRTLILAMVMNPDIQRKAQTAIEAVVDKDRLPEFVDLEPIPYLHAVIKETMRWGPVTPLGVPHATSEDDVYRGYLIPKGTTIIGNSWAILQDETLFGADTHLFKPERFLNEDGTALNPAIPDPDMVFGYGRRICPAQFMAYAALLVTGASLLHCYDICKARDEDGNVIEPDCVFTDGLLSAPSPFSCDFRVRSPQLKRVIQDLEC